MDLLEMRVSVVIGFPLGGLLAIAIQAVAFLVFFDAGIQVEHLSRTVLPVALALGTVGLAIALVGVFAATFGATLETLFSTGYDLAQYFGWAYGEVQPPACRPFHHQRRRPAAAGTALAPDHDQPHHRHQLRRRAQRGPAAVRVPARPAGRQRPARDGRARQRPAVQHDRYRHPAGFRGGVRLRHPLLVLTRAGAA